MKATTKKKKSTVLFHITFLTKNLDLAFRFYSNFTFLTLEKDTAKGYLHLKTPDGNSFGFHEINKVPKAIRKYFGFSGSIYFLVENIDSLCKSLTEKGISFMLPPKDMPWGQRIAFCCDPDGRTIIFAEIKD